MQPTVYVVDDDVIIREALTALLESEGLKVSAYPSANDFLESYQPASPGCVLLDIDMPNMNGLALQDTLMERNLDIPIIFLTGQANVSSTIHAFKKKAFDFLEKPASDKVLLESIHKAIERDAVDHAAKEKRSSIMERIQRLTLREKDVFVLLVSGYPNKQIGLELGISIRTVEGHRRRIFEKMETPSFAVLIEMAHVVGIMGGDEH